MQTLSWNENTEDIFSAYTHKLSVRKLRKKEIVKKIETAFVWSLAQCVYPNSMAWQTDVFVFWSLVDSDSVGFIFLKKGGNNLDTNYAN